MVSLDIHDVGDVQIVCMLQTYHIVYIAFLYIDILLNETNKEHQIISNYNNLGITSNLKSSPNQSQPDW